MYNLNEYKNIASNYGRYASWAIWDYDREIDTTIISQNYTKLHSKYILLGLNVSGLLNNINWVNFHSGKHDRKIKYACNDTKLRGSYMTDIFKDLPEPNSNKIDVILTQKLIDQNVELFNKEMKDIKINNETKFIIFGKKAFEYFNLHFKKSYKNKIIFQRHYSSRGTDKEWVESFWEKMNIGNDYNSMIMNYKKIT